MSCVMRKKLNTEMVADEKTEKVTISTPLSIITPQVMSSVLTKTND